MSITIFSQGKNLTHWINALKEKRPELKVRVYPDTPPQEEVEFAMAWNHPIGAFKEFKNIRCIASMGAGVDHILKDPDLPEGATVTKIKDMTLAEDMATFTLALVLNHMRDLNSYKAAENTQTWEPKPYLRSAEVTIGIMGLGALGTRVATRLKNAGFRVNGWARTAKAVEGIGMYTGAGELDAFLAVTDILICLLPLTRETKDILNRRTLAKLPQNAFVINVARGEHLVEDDLITLIDGGHLAGASLDVFREEPLPEDHPFWAHPKINVTPHIASVTDPASAVLQILENYDRLQHRQPLINVVSRTKGY